ncbi:MAG: amino acid ABC transporter substrate-binding protein [Burkholderiales bacterium]|jgi:glutamate/aspartate transport system substrate-binding protein|nr:amino acid ABC transporter substrate-binding protein [Burkholderiales bacterium]MCA3155485.1 amino acid ABC transporter substrate-binding protein [Burkholderiales bacterium]MCA3156753.1 amino acid ABC transporter substrate-binding protein [Burkholderiales bacterium]MCA3158299.1 amino acid ABC transporter substrate-binding protein [Burkholderiales bacterium]MCA3161221.1 amino acid ABC transporter substrate-binding protein [Burkholderiales bacterium]
MKKLVMFAALAASAGVVFAQSTGTLKKVQDTGAITMGVREASIPMSYLDDKQQFVGYHIDVCNRVIDDLRKNLKLPNLKVNLQAVTSANRIPLMQNGTIDIECGSTTNTVARQQQVAFALTTFISDVRILTKANSGIKTVADLNNKPLAVTTGTTSVQLIRAQEQGKNLNITEVFGKDHAESFLLLETDRAVAFALDDYLLAGFRARSNNPAAYVFLDQPLRTEPIAIMIRKDDPDFKKAVDDSIRSMMRSGELERIYSKWFTTQIPTLKAPLNMPMTNALREQFRNPNDTGI